MANPAELKGKVGQQEHHRPDREKLHGGAYRCDFFGQIKWMTDKAIEPGSDEFARLGHDAERAAKLYEDHNRQRIPSQAH